VDPSARPTGGCAKTSDPCLF